MNRALLAQVVEAVLYEGYLLYPYRPSSKKNCRERFTFGRVYPQAYSDAQGGAEPCVMQTQCLVQHGATPPALSINIGFLQPLTREIGEVLPGAGASAEPRYRLVPELQVGDRKFQPWHEAVEHKVEIPPLNLELLSESEQRFPFSFPGRRQLDPIQNGDQVVGVELRHQPAVTGVVEVAAKHLSPTLFRVTVRILNQTPLAATSGGEDSVLLRTFASTHTVLHVREGEFVSLLDPPAAAKTAAAECQNVGTWPVLVGDEAAGERDTLLSSPIILYDYPKIAPESAGTLFDGTEIDEILTLRILTMTEQEKQEMRNADALARQLLERTEALPPEALMRMHGALRERASAPPPVEFDDFFGANVPLRRVAVGGRYLEPGARVRIHPKGRADIMDMALAGRVAVVEAIEEDLEHRIHLALVLEEDPGKDLGLLRQPGHRFFFGLEEIEPLAEQAA